MVTKVSPHTVGDTVARFLDLLGSKSIKVFAVIDQRAEARAVGFELRETTLIMFGNGLTAGPGGVIVSPSAFTGQLSVTGTSGSNSLTANAVAELTYAGEYQVNVTLPANVPSGNYTLTMTVPNGSTSTSGISVILPVGP